MHHGADEAPRSEAPRSEAHEEEVKRLMNELFMAQEELRLGATGMYPDGKLTNGDEGEITFGVTAYHGQVIINFGKPIAWIGMSPEQARELALSLRKNANAIKRTPGL